MGILRKEKEEREQKEEKFIARDKKNFNSDSRSRRKKKDPAPWGKKERYLIFFVLSATILASVILAFSARNWKLPGLSRIAFPSFRSGTIVIEKDKAELDETAKEVISSFKEKTKSLSGVYGLYIIRLDNGVSYGVNENDTFEPASLNKLPVMLAMYLEAEKGSINLETTYILKSSDKVAGSGSLYGKPEGFELTYREILSYMGKESDNTAANIARNLLGEEKIKQAIEISGMENTVVIGEDQKTTPYDIGLFFEKLWEGDVISKKHKDELLGFLTDTIYEEWLAAGIPSSIDVAHKYGREIHVVNDAGILFTDEPFILVLLSKGVVEREADQAFPEISKAIYNQEAK
ncbi:class A beta-lactamase-related serine hydrolase [Patescibacteria group bacterium]|nr:class A beta-lactamase-related serine hydrolase [Patescibacteria group bacterium]MBU0777404.1 class A beta-lactamase-related serine hydrolase [Patescibacteria group bacterium]MBU0846040.1 class A beta-lactamase-related serine hydrolase [Patescibacteria group bacterium]MBU0922460.1 class A beta-lactamase-related serine hydrolase [Patescibacteria group bacterium]MBU1066807.1 class A beta-lactamase-related serine hydrolase [Patescibacteria group bacterium]